MLDLKTLYEKILNETASYYEMCEFIQRLMLRSEGPENCLNHLRKIKER